jgi:hypothetical protein
MAKIFNCSPFDLFQHGKLYTETRAFSKCMLHILPLCSSTGDIHPYYCKMKHTVAMTVLLQITHCTVTNFFLHTPYIFMRMKMFQKRDEELSRNSLITEGKGYTLLLFVPSASHPQNPLPEHTSLGYPDIFSISRADTFLEFSPPEFSTSIWSSTLQLYTQLYSVSFMSLP